MATNDFVPVATAGGANVLSQSAYLSSPLLGGGNQTGIASSAFNNKAIRQATFVASSLCQFLVDVTGLDTLDNGVESDLITTMMTAFKTPPFVTSFTGSGTYTVDSNVLYIKVEISGAGGGGGGGGSSGGGSGGSGGQTTFGTSLMVANGGSGGGRLVAGGSGGTSSLTSPASNFGNAFIGGDGSATTSQTTTSGAISPGGLGGASFYGGGGSGGYDAAGNNGRCLGSGGGGGSGNGTGTLSSGGSGGGAGGYAETVLHSPASSYSYSVGTGGAGGTAGSGGFAGGNGANGFLVVTEYYQ